MNTKDILDYIETQGFNWRYSWRKDYGNGTELLEVKLYKSARHRKPVGLLIVQPTTILNHSMNWKTQLTNSKR